MGGCVPDHLVDLLVLEAVKNAVRADQDVVQPLSTVLLEYDFRVAYDDAARTAQMGKLGLTVSESAADGKPSRKYAVRADKRVVLVVRVICWWHILPHLLRLGCRHSILHYSLRLVDMAAGLDNPIKLAGIRRLVVM